MLLLPSLVRVLVVVMLVGVNAETDAIPAMVDSSTGRTVNFMTSIT